MSPEVTQMRSAAMSAIWSLSGEKQTSLGHRVFVDAEIIRGRPLQQVAGHGKEEAALRPRTQSAGDDVLLRQKSICDNQSHHARENQQRREGFSDHWPGRIARSR